MKISRESGRRAATGEALEKALAALRGPDVTSLPPKSLSISLSDERDDSGALPAGHAVTWRALWDEADPPSYFESLSKTRGP